MVISVTMYVHIYIIQKLEIILRLSKTQPVPVKAEDSGIKGAYIMLWSFINYYFFISSIIKKGKFAQCQSGFRDTGSEREKMASVFTALAPKGKRRKKLSL